MAHWKVSEKKKDLKGNSFVSIPVFETSSDKITEEHLDKNSFKLYMFREVPFAVTNLVIYTDEKGKIQYELIKYIPDRKVRMQDNVKFTGHTIVTDWNGKFIKGYKIKNGQVTDNIYEQKSQKNGKVLACEYIDTSWTEIGANSEGGYIIVHQSGYFSDCGGQDPNSLASSELYGFFPSIPSNTGSSPNGSGTSSITLTDDQIVDAVQAELPEGGCLQERLYNYANIGDGIAQRDILTKVNAYSQVYFCFGGLYNDSQNAFKHIFWNALMAQKWNYAKARALSDRHEDCPGQSQSQHDMDTFNNDIGATFGNSNKNLSGAQLATEIYCKVKNGEGKILSSSLNSLVPSNDIGNCNNWFTITACWI